MSRYVETLEPCEFKPGFYKVPGLPFSVNEEGLVFSYRQMKIPPAFFSEEKVKENKYIHADKHLGHRLCAMTFLKLPEGKTADECLVNHLNGLKYDNRKENLEWTDYVGNSIHAYKTGLREDNIKTKSLNLFTGEVKIFYSLWDAARYFEVNGGRIHGYLNRKKQDVLFLEHYLLTRLEENFPPENVYRKWRISIVDIDHIVFNVTERKGWLYSGKTAAFISLNVPFNMRQELVKTAIYEERAEMFYKDYIICPYSWFRENCNELIDNRKSREERYANYKPKRV